MLIFVYGKLLKNLERSYALNGSECLGDAVASGVCLYNLGYYPGIKNDTGTVIGELYNVDDITLEILDVIEGFDSNNIENSLYLRLEIQLITHTPSQPVFSYFYNSPVPEEMRIENGDYRNFLQSRTVL